MATRATQPKLGLGFYTIAQAARLIGAHHSKIRRWVGEYKPLIKRRPASDEGLTFLELMELQFINMFRSEGVTMPTIRKAAEVASKRFNTEYPFAVKRFDTDGKSIFATLKKRETDSIKVEDLNRGQYVFEQIAKPFFRRLEYHGQEEVFRYWPLQRPGRVVLDPQRKFGQPIDFETGVPTRIIYESMHAGSGQDARTVAEWFDIPVKAVRAAVEFEKSLAP